MYGYICCNPKGNYTFKLVCSDFSVLHSYHIHTCIHSMHFMYSIIYAASKYPLYGPFVSFDVTFYQILILNYYRSEQVRSPTLATSNFSMISKEIPYKRCFEPAYKDIERERERGGGRERVGERERERKHL